MAHERPQDRSIPAAPVPDLQIVHHRPADADFEEQLRDVVSHAPYLGVALAVHALILALFLNMEIREPTVEKTVVIQASHQPEFKPVPPPEPPPPLELVPPDMVVTEVPVDAFEVDTPEVADVPALEAGPPDQARSPENILGAGVGTPGGGDGDGGGKITRGGPPTLPFDDPVRRGLAWLAHHQADDGHWSSAGFMDECGEQGQDTVCDGGGNPAHDVGVTSLALLAFLGAGHTDKQGEHRRVVKDGLRYLADVQSADGNFGLPQHGAHSYDHILATLAFVEAFARTGERHLRRPAERGLAYMAALRTPGGAWRYAPEHPEMLDPTRRSDTSVTGWAVLALTTAKEAGLELPPGALPDALDFLDEVTDPDTGRAGYTRRGEAPARESGREDLWPSHLSESLTAVAVLSRIFADPEMERAGHLDLVRRGIQRLVDLPPAWSDDEPGRIDFYYWYYGAYALYQYQEVDRAPWRAWDRPLRDALIANQHAEGERKGSWDPQVDPWGHLGGRVYSTALLTLTLEVSYRYGTVLSPR